MDDSGSAPRGMMCAMRFEIGHDVTIDRPVEEVFPVLAYAADLERLLRLSPMLTRFTLVEDQPGPDPGTQVLVFRFTEHVPVIPRLYAADVTMRCEQTVDRGARRVDYRSRSTSGVGIAVHKVRTVEPVAGGTRVSEVIHGSAPPGLHLIARRGARQQHRLHMDRYHELFDGSGR